MYVTVCQIQMMMAAVVDPGGLNTYWSLNTKSPHGWVKSETIILSMDLLSTYVIEIGRM